MRKVIVFILFLASTLSFSQNQSIGFIENKGQIVDQFGKNNNKVKYLLNTPGLNVQLRENGFSYDVYEIKKHSIKKEEKPMASTQIENSNKDNYSLEYTYHRIDIDFENSNKTVQLFGEEKSTDYDNYYNVPNKPNGITNVHKYQRVTYKNIYPNIDVVFFVPEDKAKPVEYNFIIHQGGKLSDIQLKFKGVKTELVDHKIKMNVRFGEMEETIPMSWVENEVDKKEVTISYKKIRKNVFGFESIENVNGKITIDPIPIRLWGTYYGGYSFDDISNSIKVDTNENVILSGVTHSSNNIATIGAFQINGVALWENGFIAKFNSLGQRIWGTYIANLMFSTFVLDSVVNSNNDIYIVGYTWDQDGLVNNLTTPGSHKEFGSPFSREGLIMKFDSNGQRIWGTFYGGEGFDEVRTITLDNQNNLIIGGKTSSTNGIATTNSYLQSVTNPSQTGFFAKFNPMGVREYGSYFYREINYIAIDQSNNIYFSGQYYQNSNHPNISTTNAHQTQCFSEDVFLIKFSSNFSLLWCTYYGGTEYTNSFGNSDRVTGLSVDNQENIYLIGTTSSSNNISTPGSFKETILFGSVNGFVTKFSPNGIRLWGTYYGNGSTIYDSTIESGFVNPINGEIYVMGNTREPNYFGNSNSFQISNRGSDECFFAKFNTNGFLNWSTFYGTPSQDFSLKIYFKNYIYIVGYSTGIATNGNDLGTPGTFNPIGGGWDFFIGKFQDCLSSPNININTPICIGNNLNLSASGGTNYTWTGPNGFTSNLQNPIIANATTLNSGQYSCTITGTGGCDDTITMNVLVGDATKPIPNTNPLPTITGDCNTIIPIPSATDNCSGNIIATTTDPLIYSLPGNYTINWTYDDGNGNIETQIQNIVITAVALPISTSSQSFCIQQNATINDITITGQNIQWYDAQVGGNLLNNSTLLVNGVTYYASQTITGCESERVPITITIYNTPTPTATANQSFCSTQNATLSDIIISGSSINWYNDSTLSTILPSSTLLQNNVTYYATQTLNNCESINNVAVTINLINTLNANNYSEVICDDLNDGSENINLNNYTNFLISGTGNTFAFYNSQLSAQNQIASELINSNYTLTLGSHTIYVRIDSVNSCYQIVTITLELVAKPIITTKDTMPICFGSSITVNAGNGFDSYLWSTNETTSSIIINQSGNYNVTVTQNHGTTVCSSTKNFTVVNSSIAEIAEIITTDWEHNSITVMISSNSTGDYEYSLDNVIFQDSNFFDNLASGIYTVYIRDKNGCGTISEEVYLLTYPKYFTPNNDGIHDFWKIKFSELEPNLTIKLFDRYGKFIQYLDANSEGWDGTLIGKKLPADDYWFVVVREDGRIHKGHFALKR